MADIIDRGDLLHQMRYGDHPEFNDGTTIARWYYQCVKKAPAIQGKPEEAEWIEDEDEMYCSGCGAIWNYQDNDCDRFKHCPNCGAPMKAMVQK